MKKVILTLLFVCINSLATTQYVYNVSKEQVIIDSASEAVRPIASVTKLMTAIIILDSSLSMDEKVPYKGSKQLSRKPRTREELLSLMLIKSDNNAADALASSVSGGRDAFIQTMNEKARSLGMVNTTYEDSSGLGFRNQSTARDLALLLQHAYRYDKIRQVASTQQYIVMESAKRVRVKKSSKLKKKKTFKTSGIIVINNTNYNLLVDYKEIEISKTGFTNPAGKCLAMFLTKHGDHFVVVILGERNTSSVQKVSRGIIDRL